MKPTPRQRRKAALGLFDRLAPSLALMALGAVALEAIAPLRARVATRRRRWTTNAVLGGAAGLVARLVVLPALTGVAARSEGRGLLGLLRLPAPARAVASFLLLDYGQYLWHRANHESAFLWRFHAPHHVDPDVDFTTAFRFHAAELLLSVPARGAIIAALGITPRAVVAYDLAMQLAATFHHSSVRLPPRLEALVGLLLVTPSMHGTHHSDCPEHLASDWGVVFSFWDRLHGTRRIAPQSALRMGVPSQPDAAHAVDPAFVALLPWQRAGSG